MIHLFRKTARCAVLLAIGIPFFAGCGGDDLGDGSGTLQIQATIEATNRSHNASTDANFDTKVEVDVREGGTAVSGASVVVETDLGRIDLSEVEDGEYEGSQSGYAPIFRLTVESGDDYLEGVRLTGPEIHTFDDPDQGGEHPADADMTVRWSPSGADRAEIEVAELDLTTVPDTGEYVVLGQHLQASEGDAEEEEVALWRTNVLTPAGTTTGSEVSVSVRNTLNIFVVGP